MIIDSRGTEAVKIKDGRNKIIIIIIIDTNFNTYYCQVVCYAAYMRNI